jgi:hypothetical protein
MNKGLRQIICHLTTKCFHYISLKSLVLIIIRRRRRRRRASPSKAETIQKKM